ncbi:hypothetical protein LTR10_007219 [Elasticomyces elasticus]|uniref:Uncharacterized protein n=1 Tax=Elasticomyces elasticus TaxID=574655 RepID=A0AAN7ZPU5_9PEZI|nr:hypothetical protein LTR10_007219 [Elasticomyces elasticus]KAK4979036.1 hypothetical protein LTR42_001536 [Elasticomyces elasticus]KAK5704171.1 hypothetical protein LTR97_003184 [Elasticomyces elasticus]
MAFIANWAIDKVQTTAAGYLKTGIQAGGNMAGNAVGGVGSLIENGGRSFGEGTVGGGIKGVGGYINTYGDGIKGSMAADGPVGSAQRKTAVKPSAVQPSTKNRITDLGDVPQKTTPAARKALPSTGGVPKALPAAVPKANGAPRPVAGAAKIAPPAANRPKAPAAAAVRPKYVGSRSVACVKK